RMDRLGNPHRGVEPQLDGDEGCDALQRAFTFSAQRYVIGTVVLFALLALRRNSLKPTPWLPTIAIGLTQTMAFQALAQWALVSGGAGKTALLAYTMPFWVVPLAWWWVHEKPGLTRWLCIVIA